MKKFIAILSMFLFTFTSSTSTLVYANELQTNMLNKGKYIRKGE